MYDYDLFLTRLRNAKKEKNMTNEELAELSGVPASTIDKIMTGKTRNPRVNSLISIAESLGTSLDYLLYGRTAPSASNLSVFDNNLHEHFDQLNEAGKNKAISYAQDLASSPLYNSTI